jgi:hypothetical protein
LLTGSAEPSDSALARAIPGGKEIGPDLGYGPARLLNSSEVQAIASALATVSAEDLTRRFNLDKMIASGPPPWRSPAVSRF